MRLLIITVLVLTCGCTSTGDVGLGVIENMTDEQFTRVTMYTKLGVQLGVRELVNKEIIKEESKPKIQLVADTLGNLLEGTVSESVGELVLDTLERLDILKDFEYRDLVFDVLKIAESYIIERGGWGVIRTADGTWLLSERSKSLILALIEGIEAGLE